MKLEHRFPVTSAHIKKHGPELISREQGFNLLGPNPLFRFHLRKFVSRYRDPQLQFGENSLKTHTSFI